ncbi:FAD-dependent oxidoreductase [Amycolatopsis decaplanina DSM 44594]|uniref:FAD-dependent oxidoreductase n=1 Tax=Amycolatopsis decaplanina DSM 44594 TaxID=1284240 RepID=M2X6S7_9PSEU|nr:FAD-dependent oxidoreductase [Amycolatopsis decaplanina DSM 44594]
MPSIPKALAAYEGLRRERVEAVVERGKRNGDATAAGSRRTGDPNAFMWRHRIDWEAPVG